MIKNKNSKNHGVILSYYGLYRLGTMKTTKVTRNLLSLIDRSHQEEHNRRRYPFKSDEYISRKCIIGQ